MSLGVNQISTCEVCGNRQLIPVLDLGDHPMCDDLVRIGESRVCREYPIDIVFCETCRTAHQRYQVPKQELFPVSYHYRSRFTADVLDGMASLVGSCEQRFGSLAGRTVLDIGCNDGSLLDFFRQKGATTVGIEPTGAAEDARQKGHAVYAEYLSPAVAETIVRTHGKPDFVTFTNVFAHIENLSEVFESLRRLIAADTVIVIENHYLGSVLDRYQFDTFYHEHPRSYSYTSFVYMARSLGMQLLEVEFPSRYGGNIRVFLGREGREGAAFDHAGLDAREAGFLAQFLSMREGVERWRVHKRAQIEELVAEHGRLRAKAFPGRAAILVKLLGLTDEMIAAVYEKPGSLKIGHYLPGTRIPIHSDDELLALPDRSLPLLNLAWHIPGEIRSYMQARGYTGQIIDILSPEDFQTNSGA